ncbi:MAG TPA: class I SAM-dependent methyltransferase [Candidatus Saccharimonadales bacterium]|nr:class I SAM-dependent methyltransferase [Candidatus Saccharimonadales bacterium]
MTGTIKVYEQAVTTDRTAKKLARKHGFKSLTELADSLPKNARVLDLGAGASPFGREVAGLRPDITWVNLDHSYKNHAILNDVGKNSPKNLEYVFADATELDKLYKPQTFDVVFSYWLLPHLSIDDYKPAIETAKAIFTVTKTAGLMSVGPKINHKSMPSLKSGKSIRLTKIHGLDIDAYANRIFAETKL